MKIYANCSESVMRFHTNEPKKMQKILQLIADEINANSDFEGHKSQVVPLFKTEEEYDTNWNKELSYSGEVRKKFETEIAQIWKDRDEKVITQEEAMDRYNKIQENISKEVYPNSLLSACAGLGDNEAVISVNKKKGYFDLNIGNNDISPNTTGWTSEAQEICECEEAEGTTKSSKALQKKARDCCCGITYFK